MCNCCYDYCGLFVRQAKSGYNGHEDYTQAEQTVKTSTTSASVLHYIRIAKKTFQIAEDKIIISLTAKKVAKSIVQDENAVKREQTARDFMDHYEGHYPMGVQTLGGVFFSIADAESTSTVDVSKLKEAAMDHLRSQTSVGYISGPFAIGASDTSERTSRKGKAVRHRAKSDTEIATVLRPTVMKKQTQNMDRKSFLTKVCNSRYTSKIVDRSTRVKSAEHGKILKTTSGHKSERVF